MEYAQMASRLQEMEARLKASGGMVGSDNLPLMPSSDTLAMGALFVDGSSSLSSSKRGSASFMDSKDGSVTYSFDEDDFTTSQLPQFQGSR